MDDDEYATLILSQNHIPNAYDNINSIAFIPNTHGQPAELYSPARLNAVLHKLRHDTKFRDEILKKMRIADRRPYRRWDDASTTSLGDEHQMIELKRILRKAHNTRFRKLFSNFSENLTPEHETGVAHADLGVQSTHATSSPWRAISMGEALRSYLESSPPTETAPAASESTFTAAAAASTLAPRWKEKFSKRKKRCYYVNEETRETTWTKPDESNKCPKTFHADSVPSASTDAAPLAPYNLISKRLNAGHPSDDVGPSGQIPSMASNASMPSIQVNELVGSEMPPESPEFESRSRRKTKLIEKLVRFTLPVKDDAMDASNPSSYGVSA